MVGREAVCRGVLRDVVRAERPALADDQRPAGPCPWGTAPIAAALLGRDAAGDEPLDAAAAVGDAQRREPRADQLAHAIHDDREHAVDVQLGRDGARRRLERRQALSAAVDLGARPGRVHGELDGPDDRRPTAPVGGVEEEAAERPRGPGGTRAVNAASPARSVMSGRRCQRAGADLERRQGRRADLEHRAAGAGDVEDRPRRAPADRVAVRRRGLLLPALERLEGLHQRERVRRVLGLLGDQMARGA